MWQRVFLISPPRCRATCLLRVLEQSTPFKILYHPFVLPSDRHLCAKRPYPWNLPRETWDIPQDMIVKDLSITTKFHLKNIVAQVPNAKFILVIRHPKDVQSSLYRVCQEEKIFYPRSIPNIQLSFDALKEIHLHLMESYRSILPEKRILVTNTDNILQSVRDIFEFLNVPLPFHCLEWPSMQSARELEKLAKDWSVKESLSEFRKWHPETWTSVGLQVEGKDMHSYRYFESLRV